MNEVAVLLGNLGLEVLAVASGRHGSRDKQVNAERLATDTVANPLDVGVNLVRRGTALTHDGQAARIDNFHHHILAVGERDDRVLDPELLTESSV